jgi:hypothetical protein
MKDVLRGGSSSSFHPLSQSLSSRPVALSGKRHLPIWKPDPGEGPSEDRQRIDVPSAIKIEIAEKHPSSGAEAPFFQ